ncbi:glycerol-3-phosphate transporter [Klebsiella pneumoniae]|nr:MFS transporter [Klebsiella pneumoniae]STW56978.1 glycerol-3-phosphate transporter [Klebsiella pneumoniae]
MLSIFKPAAHKARLPAAEIDPLYRRLRWQIFIGIFFGYAAYYLVRKNFALAMPYLIEQGFSRGDLGFALSGISIAYGFSKFIMGSVSDRSNPRIFLPAGLILAALVMLVMGFVPWATSSIMIMFVLPVPLRAGSRGWAGRRAAGPWCTGGRRKSAAGLFGVELRA